VLFVVADADVAATNLTAVNAETTTARYLEFIDLPSKRTFCLSTLKLAEYTTLI
jgi:hypothetical protein